jgi:hypothetical protein
LNWEHIEMREGSHRAQTHGSAQQRIQEGIRESRSGSLRVTITRRPLFVAVLLLVMLLLLGACNRPELPALPSLPGLTEELRQIPEALEGLNLPDLTGVDIPGLDSLPILTTPPGAIVFAGPTERRVVAGERVPGTDVTFEGVEESQAIFTIQGMRSPRVMGDSIIYDGSWPGLPGSRYSVHYRIYRIANDGVRLAGVQQLLILDLQPQPGAAPASAQELNFPYTDAVSTAGDTIAGTTLGYLGKYERGAQLTGLPEGEYPYRNTSDSIRWEGSLRPDVGAQFDLRMLTYGVDGARVGGTVTVTLPGG